MELWADLLEMFLLVTVSTNTYTYTHTHHHGDWYYPNGSVLGFIYIGSTDDLVEDRESQEVHIRHRYFTIPPTGIYHCDIEAIAVHDDEVQTVTGETVFVGLYLLSEGMNLNKYISKLIAFTIFI